MPSWRSAELVKQRDNFTFSRVITTELSKPPRTLELLKKKAMKQISDCPRGDCEEYYLLM
jgi:hypothetical protein